MRTLSGKPSLTPPLWKPHPHAQRTGATKILSRLFTIWAGPQGLACTGGNASQAPGGCVDHRSTEGPPPWAAWPSRAQARILGY